MSKTYPIEAIDVCREWPQPRGPPVLAVQRASLHVSPGQALGLLGPNGAGKTTLMQILATLVPATSGTARIAGHDVHDSPKQARENLGYLSTTSGLPSRLSVRECVLLFARLHRLPDPRGSTAHAIERFRLAAFAERFTEGLSTGMRQRLRVACATVHRPAVLLLDEPTAGLDLMSTDELLDEIAALRDEGASVLYSTHRMSEAERLCDRLVVLHEGRVLDTGTPAEIVGRANVHTLADAFRSLVHQ